MTADFINLRHARRAKARAEKALRAKENSRKFGQPKPERLRAQAQALLEARRLEGLQRDPPDPDPQG